jgi:hypothetical protein
MKKCETGMRIQKYVDERSRRRGAQVFIKQQPNPFCGHMRRALSMVPKKSWIRAPIFSQGLDMVDYESGVTSW